MKHAVIFAHPRTDSFTAAVAGGYVAAARKLGHEVVIRDLYADGFDPCLHAEEVPGPSGCRPRRDVIVEREMLAEAKVFALVYPLWFNAPPAMLKGYVDRVFGRGFGFGEGMEPLLQGRKLMSFSSSGAPTEWVKETGAWRAIRRLFDEHVAEVCGLEVLDHIHFGEITPGIRADAVEDCLDRVAAAVEAQFAPAAA